jgi:hypothetical protein
MPLNGIVHEKKCIMWISLLGAILQKPPGWGQRAAYRQIEEIFSAEGLWFKLV